MTEIAKPHRPTLGERLRRNPVTLKELRGRMRGARAFVVLTIYVMLMSGFTALLYLAYSTSTGLVASSSGSVIGKIIFGGVLGVQLFMVCFVAPSFTAGSISGERERQTFELLRTTLLPARSLVRGKLGSALSYVILLLLAAVPLQSLAFLMGGVTAEEVVLGLLLLLVTAILFSSVGLFFSSLVRRTLAASVLTYVFALGTTLGVPLLLLIFIPAFELTFYDISSPLLEISLIYLLGILVSTNPILTVIATEVILLEEDSILFFEVYINSANRDIILISPWIVYVLFAAVMSMILMAASVRVVKRPEK
jgi:hypothetical protein